ncbi:hypothetical protein LY76DRAFT_652977 [Colletotrichum caudatum]|nr:hypothetical protein LY76DRAFT_652977 [Colletotrichum caudatum]
MTAAPNRLTGTYACKIPQVPVKMTKHYAHCRPQRTRLTSDAFYAVLCTLHLGYKFLERMDIAPKNSLFVFPDDYLPPENDYGSRDELILSINN